MKESKLLKQRGVSDCSDVEMADGPSFGAVRFARLETGTDSGCEHLVVSLDHFDLIPAVQKRLSEMIGCRSCEVTRVRGVELSATVLRVRYRREPDSPVGFPPMRAMLDERVRPLDGSARMTQAIFDHLDPSGAEVQVTLTEVCEGTERFAADGLCYRRGLHWRRPE